MILLSASSYPKLIENTNYKFKRIKPKDLEKLVIGEMKHQRKITKNRKYISLFLLFVVLFAVIYFDSDIVTAIDMLTLIGIYYGVIEYFRMKRRTRSYYRRLSLIGIISRSFLNRSYRVNTKFNTYKTIHDKFHRKQKMSPFSFAVKEGA